MRTILWSNNIPCNKVVWFKNIAVKVYTRLLQGVKIDLSWEERVESTVSTCCGVKISNMQPWSNDAYCKYTDGLRFFFFFFLIWALNVWKKNLETGGHCFTFSPVLPRRFKNPECLFALAGFHVRCSNVFVCLRLRFLIHKITFHLEIFWGFFCHDIKNRIAQDPSVAL